MLDFHFTKHFHFLDPQNSPTGRAEVTENHGCEIMCLGLDSYCIFLCTRWYFRLKLLEQKLGSSYTWEKSVDTNLLMLKSREYPIHRKVGGVLYMKKNAVISDCWNQIQSSVFSPKSFHNSSLFSHSAHFLSRINIWHQKMDEIWETLREPRI